MLGNYLTQVDGNTMQTYVLVVIVQWQHSVKAVSIIVQRASQGRPWCWLRYEIPAIIPLEGVSDRCMRRQFSSCDASIMREIGRGVRLPVAQITEEKN